MISPGYHVAPRKSQLSCHTQYWWPQTDMTFNFVPSTISWHVIYMEAGCQSCVWCCLPLSWNSTQRRYAPHPPPPPPHPSLYGRTLHCRCRTIEDELGEYIAPQEGPFEGWISVILGWGNWKALDRSPWSPLTFIKGSGRHRKIVGLFLSVCRLWCWISYGLRTQSSCHFKLHLSRIYKAARQWV